MNILVTHQVCFIIRQNYFQLTDFLFFSVFDLLRAFGGGANHRGDRRKPQGTDIKHVLKFEQYLFIFLYFNFIYFVEFLSKIYIWEIPKQ